MSPVSFVVMLAGETVTTGGSGAEIIFIDKILCVEKCYGETLMLKL